MVQLCYLPENMHVKQRQKDEHFVISCFIRKAVLHEFTDANPKPNKIGSVEIMTIVGQIVRAWHSIGIRTEMLC